MDDILNYVHEKLFSLKDEEYKVFQCKLMPTVDQESVIGIRTPVLRTFAKEFIGDSRAKEFLQILPHKYYEENNLHAFIIEGIKDYNTVITYLDEFLPYINNWATCDMLRPGVFKKHKIELLKDIKRWLLCKQTYTVRFAVGMLMTHFLDGDFDTKLLKLVSEIRSDEYYIKMMVAWYFATALAKQYENTLPYIQNKVLPTWTHNKTIRKAIESYRLDLDQKAQLRAYVIKES